jgi:pheromone shutdown protein TraB
MNKKKAFESYLWLLIPAVASVVTPALARGEFFSLFNLATLEAILAAGALAGFRVYLNWKDPNDPRYGK